jgi:hypothetical protein
MSRRTKNIETWSNLVMVLGAVCQVALMCLRKELLGLASAPQVMGFLALLA